MQIVLIVLIQTTTMAVWNCNRSCIIQYVDKPSCSHIEWLSFVLFVSHSHVDVNFFTFINVIIVIGQHWNIILPLHCWHQSLSIIAMLIKLILYNKYMICHNFLYTSLKIVCSWLFRLVCHTIQTDQMLCIVQTHSLNMCNPSFAQGHWHGSSFLQTKKITPDKNTHNKAIPATSGTSQKVNLHGPQQLENGSNG